MHFMPSFLSNPEIPCFQFTEFQGFSAQFLHLLWPGNWLRHLWSVFWHASDCGFIFQERNYSRLSLIFNYILFIYFVFMGWEWCTCYYQRTNWGESVLFFHHGGPTDQRTQVIQVDIKCFCPLNHFSGPQSPVSKQSKWLSWTQAKVIRQHGTDTSRDIQSENTAHSEKNILKNILHNKFKH